MSAYGKHGVSVRSFTLVAALLFSAAWFAAPGVVMGAGLDLEKAEEKVLDAYDKPNPHSEGEMECTECHEGKPDLKKDTWQTVKFINGEEGNVKLCYNCHEVEDNIHPVEVDPTQATPPLKIPAMFPLERVGEKKGTVVCSTCHYIHSKTAGLKLLRGFPETSNPEDVAKAKFKDRRELCMGCHGETLNQKSPHKGLEAEKKNCSFCHATEPKKGEKIEFTKGLISLCDFCHAATKGAHYLLVNPFADPNLKDEIANSKLPLLDGAYTCVSCHNPHGGTNEPKYLRDEFVALALKSKRVRPHSQMSLCLACHKVRPTALKGTPEAQTLKDIPLLDEDPNKLCNRCHESGLSKANAHPLKEVAAKYKERLPADWPLYKGQLTCLTCHTAGDSPVFDPNNANFVRGAPYKNRNDICWVCHKREEFAELNPHKDIQSGEGCEFCHDTKPDLKKSVELEKMKFKGDIIILCIRCHDETPHPSNTDHTGNVNKENLARLSIIIPKEFPVDARGRLTCATCHNPHAGGQQRGVVVGMEICNLCHVKF